MVHAITHVLKNAATYFCVGMAGLSIFALIALFIASRRNSKFFDDEEGD